MSRSEEWDPEPSLRRHLEALVGERSPAGTGTGLRRAEEHVLRAFEEAGLVAFRDPIVTAGGGWANVLGDLPATGSAGAGAGAPPLFILSGHIDAVEGSPGADDNASGAAAMLVLAERLGSARGGMRRATLRFAGFNLEEWGMVGSSAHADGLVAAGRRVEGMISLEMVGYVDPSGGRQSYPLGLGIGRRKTADFISIVGDGRSKRLVRGLEESLRSVEGLPVESLVMPVPAAMLIGGALSDHSSFWRHGIPAAMVGDTAFYRNPHYHAPSDRIETLSMPFLSKVTRGLAAYLERVLDGSA